MHPLPSPTFEGISSSQLEPVYLTLFFTQKYNSNYFFLLLCTFSYLPPPCRGGGGEVKKMKMKNEQLHCFSFKVIYFYVKKRYTEEQTKISN